MLLQNCNAFESFGMTIFVIAIVILNDNNNGKTEWSFLLDPHSNTYFLKLRWLLVCTFGESQICDWLQQTYSTKTEGRNATYIYIHTIKYPQL